MTETYYSVEFGVTFWSYGGTFDNEETAKAAAPGILKTHQKHDPNNKVRIVKVTREVVQ
jgi:hypothetical protein